MKGEIRIQVHAPGKGDFTMTSSYHTGCFGIPRRFKSDGVEAFVTAYLQDTSEDQSILSTHLDKVIQDIEMATNQSGKKKTTTKDEGKEEDSSSSFMSMVEKMAKAELEDKQPKTKKVKTEQGEELRQFVDLHKVHHKQKTEDLKDFLRYVILDFFLNHLTRFAPTRLLSVD